MKEFKFRGKRKDTGKWVDGEKLFEGDIIKIRDENMPFTDVWGDEGALDDENWNVIDIGIIKFKDNGFIVEGTFTENLDEYTCPYKDYSIEKLGNIFDNPELLEKIKK